MKTAVREKPILFSSQMVRAILEGHKTRTRRVVKPQPEAFAGERGTEFVLSDNLPVYAKRFVECYSPWQVGMRLWVRETFRHYGNTSTRNDEWRACVQYKADDARLEIGCWPSADEAPSQKWWNTGKQPWTPPIHMPRWASRLTLEVTDVRVERLQEIGEADAQAEGVGGMRDMRFAVALGNIHSTAHRLNFIELWDKLNGPRGFGWDANPWVFVIAFKRI